MLFFTVQYVATWRFITVSSYYFAERNGTPDSVKYLFYGTAQKQAQTASHLRLLFWIVFQVRKYSAIIAS